MVFDGQMGVEFGIFGLFGRELEFVGNGSICWMGAYLCVRLEVGWLLV